MGQSDLRPYYRKAQFYETDHMGVIHHANYVHWMEEARTDYMEQIGYSYSKCAEEHGIDIALTGLTCRYKGMVRFGEAVNIRVSITALSPAKMTVTYRMYETQTGQLRFEGTTEHFFYHREKNRPVALPKVLPELYQLFSDYVQTDGK